MSTIQDLMNSIANMEGFNVSGSIASRYNNPGNLRYAPTQSGVANTASGQFATFATPQDGWNALQSYIENNAVSGMDLQSFIYKYAPPTENNTSGYLNTVSSQLGVDPSISLSDLINGTSNNSDSNSSSVDLSSVTGLDSTTLGFIGAIALVGLISLKS